MEPRENGVLKICNEFPGYTRYMPSRPFGATENVPVSVPRSHAVHPSDTMPTEGLNDIQRLIRTLIPQFVGREIIDQKMCWCTGRFRKMHRMGYCVLSYL
jgi:sarcosine oxidase/L-pipecolate oxidase